MTTQLPAQVQKDLEAAEAIEAELAQAGEQPPTPPTTDTVEPPAETPPAAPAPAEPPPAPAADPYEQRYRTLQGMYDTDVKAVRARNTELEGEVATLKQRLDALEKAPPAPPSPETTARAAVTQEEVEAFGEDLIAVIDRVASAKAEQMTAAVKTELDTLKSQTTKVADDVKQVSQTHAGQAQTQFVAELTQLVPDWQAVNQDPLFLAWCGQANPLTGGLNQDLIDKAAGDLDAKRAAAIFSTYKATLPPAPTPPAQDTRQSELESQIAPGTTPPSAPTGPQAADRIYTTDEVNAFYRELAQGKYKGRETEAIAIEQALDLAATQGRIKA